MYKKPDFVKIKIDTKSLAFASGSCPGDYAGYYQWTGTGCQEEWVKTVLTGGVAATWQCYSSSNP